MAATAVLEVYTEDGKMAKRYLSPGGAMEGAPPGGATWPANTGTEVTKNCALTRMVSQDRP